MDVREVRRIYHLVFGSARIQVELVPAESSRTNALLQGLNLPLGLPIGHRLSPQPHL